MQKINLKTNEEYNLILTTEHGMEIAINIMADFNGETVLRVRKNGELILYDEITDSPEREENKNEE